MPCGSTTRRGRDRSIVNSRAHGDDRVEGALTHVSGRVGCGGVKKSAPAIAPMWARRNVAQDACRHRSGEPNGVFDYALGAGLLREGRAARVGRVARPPQATAAPGVVGARPPAGRQAARAGRQHSGRGGQHSGRGGQHSGRGVICVSDDLSRIEARTGGCKRSARSPKWALSVLSSDQFDPCPGAQGRGDCDGKPYLSDTCPQMRRHD